MNERFEIRKTRKVFRQKFYVATIGKNNEILQTSEMLQNKNDCYTNIHAVCNLDEKTDVIDKTL